MKLPPQFQPVAALPTPLSNPVAVVVCNPQGEVLLAQGATTLPRVETLEALGVTSPIMVGRLDGVDVVLHVAEGSTTPDAGLTFVPLRGLLSVLSGAEAGVVSRAVQLATFDRTHRYCGTCGAPTQRDQAHRARSCTACKTQHWPRVTPAVIVLVRRGDTVLLARSTRFPRPMFSTLAGFVEAGESLEDTIHREIHEEVGVRVRDLRYFGSQGWPFPHSLMVAFVAQYQDGEIVVDQQEIAEAGWFTKDALPPIPPPPSVARAMIDAFVEGRV
jgi:NAD+ diphosphatase